MSVCGQNGQAEEDSASEEVTAGAAVRDYYKQKPASKVVRVLTVLAYLLSVSLAAILLSVYYVCVWRSPELPKLNETGVAGPAARRDPRPDHAAGQSEYPTLGGGDSGVKALVAPASLDSTAVPFSPSALAGGDPTTDSEESVADNYTSEPFNSTSDYESTSNDTDVT